MLRAFIFEIGILIEATVPKGYFKNLPNKKSFFDGNFNLHVLSHYFYLS